MAYLRRLGFAAFVAYAASAIHMLLNRLPVWRMSWRVARYWRCLTMERHRLCMSPILADLTSSSSVTVFYDTVVDDDYSPWISTIDDDDCPSEIATILLLLGQNYFSCWFLSLKAMMITGSKHSKAWHSLQPLFDTL
ncbi:hypothetical protein QVD17_28604 [Tagetes erecta]|uniref:Uncharacterized protein n=1 Tax=Tagetes erecta TaxID=13708 RepID=A0AAD8KAQ3_TARER|nr:hypothetical protein QVD17_28604 [Tagetes erecta]